MHIAYNKIHYTFLYEFDVIFKKVTSLKDCQVQTKNNGGEAIILDVDIKNICSIEGVTNNTEGRRSVRQKKLIFKAPRLQDGELFSMSAVE